MTSAEFLDEVIDMDPEETFEEEASEEETSEEETSEEEASEEETSEEETFEDVEEEGDSLAEVQSENDSYTVIDYTSYFENIQNSLNVHSLILIGLIFVLGLLMGLKKL